MVLKSKKKSYLSSVYKSISIIAFPTELLLIAFSHLDIPELLCLSNVCKRFQFIGERCIAEKLKEQNVSLSLSFEQEHKWNYGIHFSFDHWDLNSGKFVFKPRLSERMKFIHSSMIKNPTIYKIQITMSDDRNNVDGSITTNNAPITTTTQKHQKFPENFIQNSCTFSIKQTSATVEKVAKVYRIGHGTTHLKTSFRFIYSITDTPPPSENANRGGERWITPKAFECYTSFFYPHEPTAHKIMMNIIQLKKRNGGDNKKRIKLLKDNDENSIKRNKGKNVARSDDFINKRINVIRSDDLTNKEKGKGKGKGKNVVHFDDIRDSLEIELDMDGQETSLREDSINSIDLFNLQEIQEQQENMMMIKKLMGPIKSSTRWVRGARR